MAVEGAPGEQPHAGAATMLPATPPTRPKRPRGFWFGCALVGVLLVVAIVLPLTLGGGSSSSSSGRAPTVPGHGITPRSAVFAESDAAVPGDPAALALEARALLTGALPGAHLSGSVRAALTHPPGGGSSPVLGAALTLDDPQLPGCVSSLAGGAALFGIDRIRYAGQLSLLIVTADSDSPSQALGYVVGTGCALPGSGIRKVVTVSLNG